MTSSSATSDSDAVATNTVSITGFKFAPGVITVKKGTKVTWTNNDTVAHTVTADDMPGPDSDDLKQGDTFSYTYNTTGSFGYFCDIHEDMKGTVIVTD